MSVPPDGFRTNRGDGSISGAGSYPTLLSWKGSWRRGVGGLGGVGGRKGNGGKRRLNGINI